MNTIRVHQPRYKVGPRNERHKMYISKIYIIVYLFVYTLYVHLFISVYITVVI